MICRLDYFVQLYLYLTWSSTMYCFVTFLTVKNNGWVLINVYALKLLFSPIVGFYFFLQHISSTQQLRMVRIVSLVAWWAFTIYHRAKCKYPLYLCFPFLACKDCKFLAFTFISRNLKDFVLCMVPFCFPDKNGYYKTQVWEFNKNGLAMNTSIVWSSEKSLGEAVRSL